MAAISTAVFDGAAGVNVRSGILHRQLTSSLWSIWATFTGAAAEAACDLDRDDAENG
ncbi:MAG: hypothetical protein M0R80_20015 [Proteobacteria bacterium]|jgi:hypothetical protein|nr:hypothetical protein [Pseudomonadota bacterium]